MFSGGGGGRSAACDVVLGDASGVKRTRPKLVRIDQRSLSALTPFSSRLLDV